MKMKQQIKTTLLVFLCLSQSILLQAQTDSTDTEIPDFEEFDFSEFGDADDTKIKRYCTQKVLYGSPTQLISIGYEGQGSFSSPFASDEIRIGGVRMAVNAPVISRSNFILNLGLTYWGTQVSGSNNYYLNNLNSTGINGTVFKPFNEKNFMIVQASADANGDYTGLGSLDLAKSTTYSATALYGWKKDENTMFAVGVSRTYRAGQLLHIPAILYNKTFNPKWGLESILPARVHLRRNFGTSGMLLVGYEIEGNSYNISNDNEALYLRRGELKPRINYQRQIKNFIWLSAQLGLRSNWRFNTFANQNPVKDEVILREDTIGNPLYFNFSLNLVSP